ncbi:MAG TPA: sigma-70 family RNA polymerase sigma factor [Bryobacteraceae bacterium]|nr:sigma-70 family RNA polymerase sigma factor [Bryobacteraceae bacterium]
MMTQHQEEVTRAFESAREDVYRYLLTLGLPPPQAQETTQEVFLRLYLALEDGERIENTRAWVFRVAHNLGLDMRAKNQLLPMAPDLAATLQDTTRSIEADLIERERMEQLSGSWKSLSVQQRQCLHLRAEGLRYREIAETMGISISSVREFLSRAILRLQKAVHE